jgi:dihydropteroate synthase
MPKYTSIMKLKDKNSNSNSSIFSTKNATVMGILNLTTDSFFDGGEYLCEKQIIKRCRTMLDEGASIIDIGAQSSRPGATQVSAKDELKKLLPIIKLLKNNFPSIIISIDTFWAETAHETILAGSDIINDISAGNMDKEMFNVIARHNVPYIIMHMQGTPQDMQKNPTYNNVVNEVVNYFDEKIKELKSLNISTIIIDPGFGFGKTLEHNYQLLNNLDAFNKFNLPLLVGASRKSMIYNLLDTTAEKALNGTSVINTIALQNGANILRVHDVKEAKECIKITTFAKNNC